MKPHLISFKLCPFVQRSVIVLLEKNVAFEITYIDLQDPPGWFREISPLGKVPVLRMGDQALFESAVIMEYLDETNPPSLHPTDPLRKALNRAWIEFGSELFMNQFGMAMAADQATYEEKRDTLRTQLARLEEQVQGPFFNGAEFNLIDAAYAPLFVRLQLLEQWHPIGFTDNLPKVNAWAETLLSRDSVKDSVVEELPELYRSRIAASGGYGARVFAG